MLLKAYYRRRKRIHVFLSSTRYLMILESVIPTKESEKNVMQVLPVLLPSPSQKSSAYAVTGV